jgi:hypothetical protein
MKHDSCGQHFKDNNFSKAKTLRELMGKGKK